MPVKIVDPPITRAGREPSIPEDVISEFSTAMMENPGKWLSDEKTFGKTDAGQKKARSEAAKLAKYIARDGVDSFKIKTRVYTTEDGNYVFALSYDPDAKPRSRSK